MPLKIDLSFRGKDITIIIPILPLFRRQAYFETSGRAKAVDSLNCDVCPALRTGRIVLRAGKMQVDYLNCENCPVLRAGCYRAQDGQYARKNYL